MAWGTQGSLTVSAASQVIDFEPPVLPGVPNEHDYLIDASASPVGAAWCEPDSGGSWSQVTNTPILATYKYTPLWVASGKDWDGGSEGVPIMGIRGSDGALMYGLTALSHGCPSLSQAFTTVGYTPGFAGGSVAQTGTGAGNQVFTVFTDASSGGNLAYAAYSVRYGVWGSWSTISLGVKSVDAVSAAETSAGGFINVFYRGTDGNVWYDAYSNNNAQGNISHPSGVSLESGPGCAGTGSYLLCAVVGSDYHIWADLYIGGWKGWTDLGSPF